MSDKKTYIVSSGRSSCFGHDIMDSRKEAEKNAKRYATQYMADYYIYEVVAKVEPKIPELNVIEIN